MSTDNLRGTVALRNGVTSASGVRADEVVLSAVRVLLGDLLLSSTPGARLNGLGLELEQRSTFLTLDTTATTLMAEELSVVIDDVSVRGRATLHGVQLVVKGESGSLSAERIEIAPFALGLGGVELTTDAVLGVAVTIAWDPGRFRMRADVLSSVALTVLTPEARVLASDVTVDHLTVDNGEVSVGRATVGKANVEARVGAASSSSASPPDASASVAMPPAALISSPHAPLIDLRVLEALNGQLDVDVDVDLTVPIIGHRKATHRVRLAIDHGTIDFRALEKNLSALEDAILDFSVREQGLVLERVNPLHPTRGNGKPVVLWPLDAKDLELANTNRVRLVAFAQPQLASSDEPKDPGAEAKPSPIALRHLTLKNIDARLALLPSTTELAGQLRPRQLGSIALAGDVSYDPGAPTPPGEVHGELGGLAASIVQLALGASMLDVANLELQSVTSLHIAFADLQPTTVRLELAGLLVTGVMVATAPRPSHRAGATTLT